MWYDTDSQAGVTIDYNIIHKRVPQKMLPKISTLLNGLILIAKGVLQLLITLSA